MTDQGALDRLRIAARTADSKQLDRLLRTGKAIKGVTQIDVGAVYRFIEANQAAAAAAIALIAVSVATASPGTDQALRAHLGLLFALYIAVYPNHSQLRDDVEHCVPDVYTLVRETERTFRNQLGE